MREIALYADYKLDESYTPSKISVRAGNSFHDLREVRVVDLDEPVADAWLDKSDESDESHGAAGACARIPANRRFVQPPNAGTRTCGR